MLGFPWKQLPVVSVETTDHMTIILKLISQSDVQAISTCATEDQNRYGLGQVIPDCACACMGPGSHVDIIIFSVLYYEAC